MTRKAQKNSWPSSELRGKECHSRHILVLSSVKWFVSSIWRYLRCPTRLIAGFLAGTETDPEEVWSAYLTTKFESRPLSMRAAGLGRHSLWSRIAPGVHTVPGSWDWRGPQRRRPSTSQP